MSREKDRGGRRIAISDDLDDLGVLSTAAHDLDTSWMRKGRCRGWNGEDELIPTPWQFDSQQTVTVEVRHSDGSSHLSELKGTEMIEVALSVCFACPAQYRCAEYAVAGRLRAGTWSMRIADLRWFQTRTDWMELIAYAEYEQIPLQRLIPERRAAANPAA